MISCFPMFYIQHISLFAYSSFVYSYPRECHICTSNIVANSSPNLFVSRSMQTPLSDPAKCKVK